MVEAVDTRKLIVTVYAISFVDLLSASMVVQLLPLYLTNEVGLSATFSGILSSAYGIIQTFSSPTIGAECDVRGHKEILVYSLVFLGPAYALLCLKWWPMILISRMSCGAVKHTQNVCSSLVSVSLPQSERLKLYGRINAMGNIGMIIGPLVSGYVVEALGYRGVILLSAVLFSASGIIAQIMLPPMSEKPDTKAERTKPTSLLDDLKHVKLSEHWDIFLTYFLCNFSVLIYKTNLVFVLPQRYGLSTVEIGYFFSLEGFVNVVASYFVKTVASWFDDQVKFLEFTMLSIAIPLAALSLLPLPFPAFLAIFVLFKSATYFFRPAAYDLLTTRANPGEIGLLMGLLDSSISAARAASPALGGLAHDIHDNLPAVIGLISVATSTVVGFGRTVGQIQKAKTS